ncbi:MAG: hypothetical protein QXT72_03360 [Candidatus Micrarchaeia archaeon]
MKKDEKIYIVLPMQSSVYSGAYTIYNDLYLGLKKLNIESEIILVKADNNNANFPYFKTEKLEIENLKNFIDKNKGFYLLMDDFSILKYLFKNKIKLRNTLIWAHYFFGHKFIFKRYVRYPRINFNEYNFTEILEFIPLYFLKKTAKFYYKTLNNHRTIAQSVWTDLLLERVYDIHTEGILYMPVEPDYYLMNNKKDNRVLVFLGGTADSDLFALHKTIKILEKLDSSLRYDSFGDKFISDYFNKKFNFNLNYLGKLERKELNNEYGKHLLTISPIYNGNFEMMPIESLLCGTPVITYVQPFMEVTGQSVLISNINNEKEIERNFYIWLKDIDNERLYMRNKILDVMENVKIGKELINKYIY